MKHVIWEVVSLKTLVTGGTGFIGASLIRELLKEGVEVKALVRKNSNTKNIDSLDIEKVYGDLCDKGSLVAALNGCNVLYHVAAHYSLWELDSRFIYDINLEGTKNILSAAFEKGMDKVVYTSTVGAIGLSKGGGIGNEETKIDPDSLFDHYKLSKYLAEKEAEKMALRGLPLVIVNPSTPVGPMDIKPTPTGKIIVDFLNKKMPAYMDTGLNLVHVEDVAKGHILAAKSGRVGERYILGHANITLRDIFKMLEEISGIRAPTIKIPYSIALTAGYVSQFISNHITQKPPFVPLAGVKMAKRYMYFDSSKAVKELGLPQTPIKTALQKAVEWFKENGYAK